MADGNYSTTVCIREDRRPEGYWTLTSKELPGFMLTGKDLAALRADTPAVLKSFFRLNYQIEMDVRPIVSPSALKGKVGDDFGHRNHWAAFPLAAQQQLA